MQLRRLNIKSGLLLSGIAIILSCNNEVDINADFVEKTFVWAILDYSEMDHYIRIEKSFLPENESAYNLALDPNNLYYNEDELEVYIEQWSNSTLITTYELQRVNGDSLGIQKDEGIYASSPNILYYFSAVLDSSAQYHLLIINHNSGIQ